ncbi:hypothetical protein [Nocardia sp. NBC_00403]|uniref:hypothetical protein n=1 Tax=Nocardia sp. NBC_00403 TaxID=2975990 RepID=UPI002E1E420E
MVLIQMEIYTVIPLPLSGFRGRCDTVDIALVVPLSGPAGLFGLPRLVHASGYFESVVSAANVPAELTS